MLKPVKTLLVLCTLVLLTGCPPKPVLNIVSEPIITGSQKVPTLDQVQNVVRQALITKTWAIDDMRSDAIDAHLVNGGGIARITVSFTTKTYDIRYVSSEGLQYDGTRIFHRYNSWIEGLQITINEGLKKL